MNRYDLYELRPLTSFRWRSAHIIHIIHRMLQCYFLFQNIPRTFKRNNPVMSNNDEMKHSTFSEHLELNGNSSRSWTRTWSVKNVWSILFFSILMNLFFSFTVSQSELSTGVAHLYFLVRAVYHGDEHVEQNHHHGDVVDAVQHVSDVLDEFMIVLQNHRRHFRQPEYGPEERFKALLHPENTERWESAGRFRRWESNRDFSRKTSAQEIRWQREPTRAFRQNLSF